MGFFKLSALAIISFLCLPFANAYCPVVNPADEKMMKSSFIDHVKGEVSHPLYGKLGKINQSSLKIVKVDKYSHFHTDKWPGWVPTKVCDGGKPATYGAEIEISYLDLANQKCFATVAVFIHITEPERRKFTWYAVTDYLVKKPKCLAHKKNKE